MSCIIYTGTLGRSTETGEKTFNRDDNPRLRIDSHIFGDRLVQDGLGNQLVASLTVSSTHTQLKRGKSVEFNNKYYRVIRSRASMFGNVLTDLQEIENVIQPNLS